MKIKLILGRTECDPISAWTAIKQVEIDVPLIDQDGWQVIGADWEFDTTFRKKGAEIIEKERLIATLEEEIDILKGNKKPKKIYDERGNVLPDAYE